MKTFNFIYCICFFWANSYFLQAQDLPTQYTPFFQQNVDFNKDKHMDSVVFLEKKDKQDGDSILVVFYIRKIDGTLEHFKTFGNLYPIYFKSYDVSYELKNNTLKDTFEDYIGLNPDTEISIKDKKITITKKPNAITYYYEFVFDNKRNNWFLSTHKTSSANFTTPTERYFFNDPKAIPLEQYGFLLNIKN